jgi:hypothetical protein
MAAAMQPAAEQPIPAGAPQDLPQEYVVVWQEWDGAKGNLT